MKEKIWNIFLEIMEEKELKFRIEDANKILLNSENGFDSLTKISFFTAIEEKTDIEIDNIIEKFVECETLAEFMVSLEK